MSIGSGRAFGHWIVFNSSRFHTEIVLGVTDFILTNNNDTISAMLATKRRHHAHVAMRTLRGRQVSRRITKWYRKSPTAARQALAGD